MRSLTPAPYLNRRLRPLLRRVGCSAAILAASLAVLPVGGARAASLFFIRGGGDGHGIGLSQYGAYGYALHGEDYKFILGHYYQGTSLGSVDPTETVRVLLATGQASFSGATTAGRTALSPGSTYSVTLTASGKLKLTDPHGRQTGPLFSAPLTVTGPAPLQVPGLGTYRGSLQFRPDGSGGVETVNALGLDDYVRGVVADEMPSSWAPQALRAQAVAARTYAITTTVGAAGYDLYDDTRSQMYGGVGAETAATDAAVAATAGQVVTYNGQPVVTYFFASSGGYTESIQNVWAGSTPEPWLRGVPDPYDGAGGDPYHRWGQVMNLSSAAAKLGSLVHGTLRGIAVLRHGLSPRILQAAVVGSRGRTTVTGTDLQNAFGLATTFAAFTTITTTGSAGAVTGTIFPAPKSGSVTIQPAGGPARAAGARAALSSGGAYAVTGLAPGRYRVVYSGLAGPTVTVH